MHQSFHTARLNRKHSEIRNSAPPPILLGETNISFERNFGLKIAQCSVARIRRNVAWMWGCQLGKSFVQGSLANEPHPTSAMGLREVRTATGAGHSPFLDRSRSIAC